MPLPESTKGCWPPEPFDIAQDAYDEIEAWWVGTPERLESVYRSNTLNQNTPRIHPSQYRGGVVGNIARRFWGDPPKLNQAGRKLHLPLGAEILQTSASLLFAEPVRITANESESAKIQKRLDKLFNTPRAHTAGLVAGEIQAAFGGVYGRIVVDPEIEETMRLGEVMMFAATDLICELEGIIARANTLSDALNAYGYPVSDAHWKNASGSMSIQARALHLAAANYREARNAALSQHQGGTDG